MNDFISAIKQNDVALVHHILTSEKTVDPSDNNNFAIRLACKIGRVEIVRLLLADPRVNPADIYNRSIFLASKYGHHEIVSLLLADKRANPAETQNVPLRIACKYEHVHVVGLLLADDRVNPADKNYEAIKHANNCHNLQILELLLTDHRINLKEKGFIKVEDYEYGYLDGIIVVVYNEDVETLRIITTKQVILKTWDCIKETYLKWKYRIGGEKHTQACNSLNFI